MNQLQTVLDALESCNRTDLKKVVEAIAIVRKMMQTEPLFFYRPVCNGEMYEGPHSAKSVGGQMLREEKPTEWVGLYPAPQAVPDPMTLMTDASIMQVAQGWREFDAPDGSGPVDSIIYGACRAALNKYRDLLLEAK